VKFLQIKNSPSFFGHVLPLLLASQLIAGTSPAAAPTITVDTSKAVAKVSPLLFGLMTEEINHCYDGGLYAELIQNRAFLDDVNTPVHWSAVQGNDSGVKLTLDRNEPLNSALPVALRLDVQAASASAPAGIANEGYWGIPVQPNTKYRASFYAKASANFAGNITLAIKSQDGKTVYAKGDVTGISGEWKRYELTLQTGNVVPTTKASFTLTTSQPGTLWFNLVSLFPPTWKDQPNGFRKDLMQMLVDLKPKFLRFPGGNYLEGDTIDTRFEWKKTLGSISERAGHPGPWGYRSTDGLGLHEFLLWCEDMKAEPVLAVFAGYALKGAHVNPGPELDSYVQDALDEIEYVCGSPDTKWGAKRAAAGHPEPFKLHYVEIGNEDFFDWSGSYESRFAAFNDAIKAKYPDIKCISTVGNEQPEKRRIHNRKPDALDEHYYRSAAEFIKTAPARFEAYDRKGSEIFVGEWAAFEDIKPWDKKSKGLPPTPSMKAALGDATWMAAMERNSDIVKMNCYAPLFANVNPGAYQWRPNLIGYDALHSFGSPSYYAFSMFSQNVGDEILKVTPSDTSIQASVTRDSKAREIIVKLINPDAAVQSVKIDLKDVHSVAPTATAITLAAETEATNSLENPRKVVPSTSQLRGVKPSFDYAVPAHGIVVLKLKAS
jgi:alpha-N-arabinofuranosidase